MIDRNTLTLAGATLTALAAFVVSQEGNLTKAYLDPVGIPTVCAGWTSGVKLGDVKTPAECDELTLRGIREAESEVNRWTPAIPHGMKPAMVSFVYNVGVGAPGIKDGYVWLKSGERSTINKLLSSGKWEAACEELPKWVYAGGRKLNGLIKRRAAEKEMCLDGLRKSFNSVGGVHSRMENS